jgi:hypothetical protein
MSGFTALMEYLPDRWEGLLVWPTKLWRGVYFVKAIKIANRLAYFLIFCPFAFA